MARPGQPPKMSRGGSGGSTLLVCWARLLPPWPRGWLPPGFGVFPMAASNRIYAASSALEGIHWKVKSVTEA